MKIYAAVYTHFGEKPTRAINTFSFVRKVLWPEGGIKKRSIIDEAAIPYVSELSMWRASWDIKNTRHARSLLWQHICVFYQKSGLSPAGSGLWSMV